MKIYTVLLSSYFSSGLFVAKKVSKCLFLAYPNLLGNEKFNQTSPSPIEMTEQPVPTIAGVLGCTRIILGESTIVFKLPANVFIWIPAIIDTNSFDLDVNIVSFSIFSRRLRSIGVKMWGLGGYKVRLLEIVTYVYCKYMGKHTFILIITIYLFLKCYLDIAVLWKV